MNNLVARFGATAALLVVCAVTAVANGTEPRYPELPNFHVVNARLYRGAQPRDGGIKRLKELGVGTIINLRKADGRSARERAEALAAGIRYYNVPLPGRGRPQDTDVQKILQLIEDPANGVVFIHCKRGKDRTGTAIACYRIADERWTSACAKREAKHYGMSLFQLKMKHYIRDFYERRRVRPSTPAKEPDCPAMSTTMMPVAATSAAGTP